MYFALPAKAKPSKTACPVKDARPVLARGEIVETDGAWSLVTTNSYVLSVVPLVVKDEGRTDVPVVAGPVPQAAFAMIEKAGFFTATIDTVSPVDQYGNPLDGNPAFKRDDGTGQFPNHSALIPEPATGDDLFRVGVNVSYLAAFAAAQGCRPNDPVVLTFDLSKRDMENHDYRKGIAVCANLGTGVLMPIRVNS